MTNIEGPLKVLLQVTTVAYDIPKGAHGLKYWELLSGQTGTELHKTVGAPLPPGSS